MWWHSTWCVILQKATGSISFSSNTLIVIYLHCVSLWRWILIIKCSNVLKTSLPAKDSISAFYIPKLPFQLGKSNLLKCTLRSQTTTFLDLKPFRVYCSSEHIVQWQAVECTAGINTLYSDRLWSALLEWKHCTVTGCGVHCWNEHTVHGDCNIRSTVVLFGCVGITMEF